MVYDDDMLYQALKDECDVMTMPTEQLRQGDGTCVRVLGLPQPNTTTGCLEQQKRILTYICGLEDQI